MINGNCTCEKKLILSSDGQIKGNISAQSVIISGKVDGDIVVQGKLEILSTGKLQEHHRRLACHRRGRSV